MAARQRQWFTFILVTALLIVGIPLMAQETPEYLIGVLDDQTGSVARGAQLAINQINDAGGILGSDGVVYRFNLVIAPTDLGTRLDEAVAELRGRDLVAVLGPARSEEIANGLSALQTLDGPILTAATEDTLLASDSANILLRTRAADVVIGQALAAHIINDFGLREIIVVQLDSDSAPTALGFREAAAALGAAPGSALLRDPDQVGELAEQLVQANVDVMVTYGSPALAGVLYRDLRAGGWEGLFVYNQADDANFRSFVAPDQLEGIISATTWAYTSTDPISVDFLLAYLRTFGEIPNPVAAASYDGVHMIAAALTEPGSVRANLLALEEMRGVQGPLNPAVLGNGELSTNVAITRLGLYGAPEVLARYVGGVQLPPELPVVNTPAPDATSTPTPQGVVISIRGERQNVRSGPSISFPVLGQLVQGETAQVIGVLPDETWVIIDYRGQQGWLATYLLDVTGDLSTVPLITPPPTATPLPATATFTPAPFPDIVIDSVTALPSPIVPNQQFTLAVAVRNAGFAVTGSFTVAASMPPNNLLLSAVVPPLAPGQAFVANVTGTLTNTGVYATTVIADAQNQVFESAPGESNNVFAFNYTVDRTVRRQAGQTLNLGDTVDLEGDAAQGDANWNSTDELALDAINGAKLGILPGTDLNAIHWDLINPASVNRDTVPRTEINVGTLIGIITADGNRGVMRVDAVNETQISLAFKVYN